ncbi:MAG: acylphosphatase [Bacillariaceae sp.]|jgi:acylphosphatase
MDKANEIASEVYDYWGALERALNETDVLRAIYGGDDDDDDDDDNSNSNNVDDAEGDSAGANNTESSKFGIVSPGREEMKRIRKKLGTFLDSCDDDGDCLDSNCNEVQQSNIPELQIEIQTRMDVDFKVDNLTGNDNDNDNEKNKSNNTVVFGGISTVQFLLSLGYPEYSSAVVTSIRMKTVTTMTSISISSFSLTRSITDEIVRILNKKSDSLLGNESILDLMEDAKDLISDHCRREILSLLQRRQMRKQLQDTSNRSTTADFGKHNGRRWIWVHHITSSDRRKSIVREARELNLTGILKHGYPGVVLIEGPVVACDEFISWIKGNKSRPGGFGRNWGHHVRGEINFELESSESSSTLSSSSTTMMKSFEEIEDLSIMAKSCKEMGLEDEFKGFVMQHK